MIEPVLSDEALLADITAPVREPSELRLWWLGQSGYAIRHRDLLAVIDPYLSDSLTTKYALTEKPHVRMHRRVIDPAMLARTRLGVIITSSHAHTDHLDPDTLRPLRRALRLASFVCPAAQTQLTYDRSGGAPDEVQGEHVLFHGINDGETWGFPDVTFTAVAAAHDRLERDANGRCKYLGYVIRLRDRVRPFAFASFSQPAPEPIREWTVYHSGDTVVYDGMVERLRSEAPIDIAILPINGKVGNMGGRDAARLAKDIGAKVVIPCHYDMFEFNTADPKDEFIPECERLGQSYRVLRLGERFSSDEIPTLKKG